MNSSKFFFSYSREDSEFALRLANDLRQAGADIWIDQLDIPAGMRWEKEVEKSLLNAGHLLVILTPTSSNSDSVADEIAFALDNGKPVIPVLAKECSIPFRIRRRQYIDFTKDYNTALARLLNEINITQTDPHPAEPKPTFWEKRKIFIGIGILVALVIAALVIFPTDKGSDGGKSKPGLKDSASAITMEAQPTIEAEAGKNWHFTAAGVGKNIYFFAKKADGRLYFNRAVLGHEFKGWTEIEGDGRTDCAPAAGAVRDHVFVVIKGIDGELYLNQADAERAFNKFWGAMNFKTDVAAAATGVGDNIYFFAKALDGKIFYNRAVLTQGTIGWAEVEGNGKSDSSPAAGAVGEHVFVLIKGIDGELYLNQADLGKPFDTFWGAMNFKTDVSPAATGVGNSIYFFAKSPDGRVFFNHAVLGGAGVGWSEVNGNIKTDSAPAAGAVGNHVYVVVKGRDGKLYYNQADNGGAFSDWNSMDF